MSSEEVEETTDEEWDNAPITFMAEPPTLNEEYVSVPGHFIADERISMDAKGLYILTKAIEAEGECSSDEDKEHRLKECSGWTQETIETLYAELKGFGIE